MQKRRHRSGDSNMRAVPDASAVEGVQRQEEHRAELQEM